MIDKCPCHGCTKRNTFCHNSCAKYKCWKEQFEERKKKIQEAKAKEKAIIDYECERRMKTIERKKRH